MDIRLIKIDDIDLSVRSLNALHNEGIETVGDLLGYTGDTLNQIRNLGKKSIDEILQIIDKYKEMESGSNLSSMEENSDIPLPELPENYGEWKESEEGKKCIISWLNENQLKISSLDLLSARSYNYLMLNGYTYVHQIIHMTREELMEIPRMSVQSAEEIINICRHFSEEKEEEIVAFYRESTISKNETNGIDIHDILYNTAFHDRVLQFLIANDIIIDKTDCSNRMKNQLHKNGFYNLSDLAFLTRYDFMNLPNMGKKTADEVVSFIERYLSDHKDRLVAFCNGDESALADDSQVGLHEIIHSKRYYDRFLQYIKQNDIEVDKLKCSKRARNQLKKNGLKNLSDIISITKNDLRALPHMGSKAADDIISVVDAYLADYEDRIIAFCKGDDAVLWDDHSIKNKILNVYNQIGFTGMSLLEIREKTGIPDLVTDERLKSVIGKMIADGLLEYVDFRCYRVYLRFSDYLASCTTVKERSKDIIHGRLHGETLESIAGIYNMTRERVRQIFNKEIQKVIDSYRVETGMEWFDEDYYRYFFETYAIDKKDAEKWLRLDSEIFNFLDMTGSKRGTGKLEDALNDYHNLDYGFRLKIKNYLNKDKLFLDGKWIDRKRWVLEDYAVRKYCRENVSFTEFCRIFNDFLREEEVNKQIIIDKHRYNFILDTDSLTHKVRKKASGRVTSNSHFNLLCCMGLLNKVYQNYERDIVLEANRRFIEGTGNAIPINVFSFRRYTEEELDRIEQRSQRLMQAGVTIGKVTYNYLCINECKDIADGGYYGVL